MTKTPKKLKELFELVCNKYVEIFCKKHGLIFDGWIGDEIGGIAGFSSQYFFNISDIMLDVDTKQPKRLILDWQTDGVDSHFSNPEIQTINYKSYTKGVRYEKLKKQNEKKYTKIDMKEIVCRFLQEGCPNYPDDKRGSWDDWVDKYIEKNFTV